MITKFGTGRRPWALLVGSSALLLSAAILSGFSIQTGADAFSVRVPINQQVGVRPRALAGVTVSPFLTVPRRVSALGAAGGDGVDGDEGDGQSTTLESDETFKTHPALSRREIEGILSDVPVYGVVSEDSGDAVLLREPDTEESIAYFFFNPDTANSAFAGLKEKGGDSANWAITRFTLGDIWFELLDSGSEDGRFVTDGVEYRLVPDGVEIGGARSLLEQSAEAMGAEPSLAFQAPYNEVPIFLDQGLRIESNGEERFPVYLGLQDLVRTCQMVIANESNESSEYSAMVVVADLRDLVNQMKEESEVEFRKMTMFPPTPQQMQSTPQDDKKGIDSEKFEDVAKLGATDWSD